MTLDIGAQIMAKAKSLGASLAGIANVEQVKTLPSYALHDRILNRRDGIEPPDEFTNLQEFEWPENARSALIIALSHPLDKPELDWHLESGLLPGNWYLEEINRKLSTWINEEYGIITHHVNYAIHRNGIYLKDLAVLSGLGCIGKSNLLINPEFGPRLRFRAMLLDAELIPTDPIDFDPCEGCEEFCRKLCPVNAFDEVVFSPADTGMSTLPARTGNYSRPKCLNYFSTTLKESGITASLLSIESRKMEGTYQTQKYNMNCRRCELACPVGA